MPKWSPYVPFILLFATTGESLQLSRRTMFRTTAFAAVSAAFPHVANAVPPLNEADMNRIEKLFNLNPPSDKIQRQKLALDFAVLLTRASYVEADQLDIVPVNQLERDMYLVRTTAWTPYMERVGSIMQGDLTDPKYFDYMSSVQYVVINRALKDPEKVFEELQPETAYEQTGGTNDEPIPLIAPKLKKVQVERTLPDDKLVSTHDERVGTSILDYMNDTYRDTPIALPKVSTLSRPSTETVQEALAQLVRLFLINGFAWEGRAQVVPTDPQKKKNGVTTFLLTLDAPATLWSGQVLAKQKAPLRNDFLLKTAKQLVASMGYTVHSSTVNIKATQERSYLSVAF